MSLNKEHIGEWYERMPDLWDSQGVRDLMSFISNEYGRDYVVPARHQIFRAFHATQPGAVKLILMGHEPYNHTWQGVSYANGLAFDCSAITEYGMPAKTNIWNQIMKHYQAYEPTHFNTHLIDGHTKYWAQRGVMMMHASLTGAIGKENAHIENWAPFIKGWLSRMIKQGFTPPIAVFTPYAEELCKSEDYPHVHRVNWNINLFEQLEGLMGHTIIW